MDGLRGEDAHVSDIADDTQVVDDQVSVLAGKKVGAALEESQSRDGTLREGSCEVNFAGLRHGEEAREGREWRMICSGDHALRCPDEIFRMVQFIFLKECHD